MKKRTERKEKKINNPLLCILVGLLAGAALFVGFTYLDVALGHAPDFVSGMKSFRNILIALVGVVGVAWTLWKKGQEK